MRMSSLTPDFLYGWILGFGSGGSQVMLMHLMSGDRRR